MILCPFSLVIRQPSFSAPFGDKHQMHLSTVQITISTGSKSPAMAREIRMRAEKYLNELVTSEDVAQINLQQEARIAAKKAIPDQNTRKKYLYAGNA